MVTKTLDRAPARQRLLDAADELFYNEGVHVVGIDRIIERAGVAKATLYSTFGSKDELVRAYLERRHATRQARITTALERYDSPRDQVLGVFDSMADLFAEPTFRGCAFANASAEAQPDSAVIEVADASRAWTRSLFVDLSRAAGAPEPEALGRQLQLLYDGANTSARMDRDPGAAMAARSAAAVLLDAALPAATA
jgi:AcrR family transcriptional regulator